MGARKLTRKEIVREDPFHAFIRETYESLIIHKDRIIAGVCLAILVGVGAYSWQLYQSKSDVEGRFLFTQALETFHAPVEQASDAQTNPPEVSVETKFKSESEKYTQALKQFNEISKKRAPNQIKLLSQYYTGLCQQRLGKTDDAIKILEATRKKLKDPHYAFLVKKALAGLYESKGDCANSIKLNTELLSDSKDSFPKDETLMDLGRCYETLQRKDEAIKKYTQLAQQFPTSQYQREANERLARLGAKKVQLPEPSLTNPFSVE